MTDRQYIIKASYGNDSIALIQWMAEHGYGPASFVVYNDTGWSRDGWSARVSEGEALALSYGMLPLRTQANFVAACRLKQAMPRHGMQFCTTLLKIEPTIELMRGLDPSRELIAVVGVRREESARRASWPEWTEESDLDGGRSLWAPLVRVMKDERDALVRRAGFDVLNHRSDECWPCVNANRSDLRRLAVDEPRIAELEALEAELSAGKDAARRMFREQSGIRETMAWAQSQPGKYSEGQSFLLGCDAGFCGL
jgi:3'-phosphoadenosine 5'-phosphosulfate sulfotransferase (PAPS reductase)/FAD synthetase